MTHIIGELARAEKHMELYRGMMRNAKNVQDHARYKRNFREERNRVLTLKRKIND